MLLVLTAGGATVATGQSAAPNIQFNKKSVDLGDRGELRINPTTRALELEIPLGSYPGRAGMNVPVTFSYSSKVWRVEYLNYQPGTPSSSGVPINNGYSRVLASYAEHSSSGWTSSLGFPVLDNTLLTEYYDGSGNPKSTGGCVGSSTPTGTAALCYVVDRILVRMPDGSTHELRSSDQPLTMAGTAPDLYSVDGSRLRYHRPSQTLFMPDGSRYLFAVGQYVDTNGNTLNYTGNGWTDTLGRGISGPHLVAQRGSGIPDAYSYTPFGMSSPYVFVWKRLGDPGVLTTPQPLKYTADTGCPLGSNGPYSPRLFQSDVSGQTCITNASTVFNPVVLHQIQLPTGRSYTFTYNEYGEIDRVELPTGGYERYVYAQVSSVSWTVFPYTQANRGVVDRYVSTGAPGAGETRWQYSPQGFSVTAPDNTLTTRQLQTGSSSSSWGYGGSDQMTGKVFEERHYSAPDPANNNARLLLRRRLFDWDVTGSNATAEFPGANLAQRNPRVAKEVEILLDTSGDALARTTVYDYDTTYEFTTGVNQTRVSEYDYVHVPRSAAETAGIDSIPAAALPLRVTETAYLDSDPAYRLQNILGLPTLVTVKNGAGAVFSKRAIGYDEPGWQLVNNYGAVTNWTSPAGARGNVTTVRHYLNVNAWTPLENACQPAVCFDTHTQYDQSGSAVKGVDALGNETLIAYSPAHDYAYPTSVTTAAPNSAPVPNPSGNPAQFGAGTFGSMTGFTTHTAYDDDTGRVTSTTDANGKTTAYDYTDPLGRLKQVDLPDGGRTTYVYADTHPCGPLVEARTLLDASGREVSSWQFFDGLGRPYLSESWDGQDAANPYFRVDTRYDSTGRVWKVSNPYRSAGCTAAANPSGRWTTTEYDALGRVAKVTTPDGARVRTEYAGAHVRVTDQANRQRVSVSDGLGRLVEVWEVKAANPQSPDPWLESFTFPATAAQGVPAVGTGYKTAYAYDVMGNLRKVNQGGQQRFFMYDSLGRLIRARNPEQGTHDRLTYTDAANDALTGNTHWSAAYGYDHNGNLTSRVDARNVETTYVYDRLNRNVITHYAGGTPATPDVRRFYDTAVGGKGRPRRSEAVGVAAAEVISYDVMGRPTERRQSYWVNSGWGQEYSVSRSYNKAGGVTSQTYPSGHTVAYNYDDAGRLGDNGPQLAFTGNLGDGVARTYASGLSYSEFGGVRQERFGTQTPLYQKRHYNVRGQLYSVRLSTHSLASNEFDWNRGAITSYYDGAYTWGGAPGSTGSGPDNNGNLRRSETFIPGDEQYSSFKAFRQDYDYDALNRVGWVAESRYSDWSGQTTPSFKQAYKYDRWGNRTIDADETQVYGQDPGYSIPEPQFELNPPTNREVAEPSNRLYAPGDANRAPSAKLMRYDAAGNLVHDSHTGMGGRAYDAENRMTEAAIDAQGNRAYYTYDADGRRVKRKISNEEWWQVYGIGGELLAEYRTGAATYLPSKEYGYRGGELLVTMSSGDDQRLRRFAQNLYYGALQRDPTAQELQNRINELAAAGAQGEVQLLQKAKEIARALFAQTSYETSPARSDAQYVTDLYYAYLHRAPDAPGLNHWTGAAAGGVANRSNVCDAFQESPEFSALVSTLYGEAESEGQRRDRLIHVFYLGAYGRIANTTELELRRGQLDAAAGAEEVKAKAELMGRELFAAQVSDLSLPAGQFVTNLYESFLQRGPDAGGLTFWTSQAGTTAQARQNVLNAFATCDPFRELARTLYRETFWLVADHLGTPRMVADRTGSLAGIKRHDYLPFGEELFAGAGGRATTQGYSAVDNVRQRFTGKERDDETKLDYFGARYYAAVTGRFASVDPIFTTLRRLLDPQQLNLYTYTRNNPLRFTDPSGMDLRVNTRDEQEARRWFALFLRGLKKSDRGAAQFFIGDGKDGYRKGSFYIKIDSNHKSDSKNFKAAQAIANDRSETANLALVKGGQDLPTLQVYADRGKAVLKNPVDVDGDVGRNYLGQQYDEGKAITDSFMYGQTLFPKPSPDTALTGVSYAPGEDIEVYVWNEQAEVEIVATMFHELSAHVFLSNMGRNIPASLHMVNLERQKSVHDAAKAAEAEAKENFKEP